LATPDEGGDDGTIRDDDDDEELEGPGHDWRRDVNTKGEVVSFWKATTAHRPESAEIAKRIEGFDDDFKYVDQEEEEEEEEEEVDEEEDLGPDYQALMEEQLEIHHGLQDENNNLQKKVLMIFEKQHRQKIVDDDPKNQNKLDAGYEVRFQSSAKKWLELLEEEDRVKQHYQAIIFDHQARLEERTQRSEEISTAFRGFKLEVARSAENSKTGRQIPESKLNELDELDTEREAEAEKLRLRNISLRAEVGGNYCQDRGLAHLAALAPSSHLLAGLPACRGVQQSGDLSLAVGQLCVAVRP